MERRFKDANIIINVTWDASVNAIPTNLLRSPGLSRAAQRRIHNDFLCCRRQERLWNQFNRHSPLVNSRVHLRAQDRDGPVT